MCFQTWFNLLLKVLECRCCTQADKVLSSLRLKLTAQGAVLRCSELSVIPLSYPGTQVYQILKASPFESISYSYGIRWWSSWSWGKLFREIVIDLLMIWRCVFFNITDACRCTHPPACLKQYSYKLSYKIVKLRFIPDWTDTSRGRKKTFLNSFWEFN